MNKTNPLSYWGTIPRVNMPVPEENLYFQMTFPVWFCVSWKGILQYMGRQYWVSYSLKMSSSASYFVLLLTFQKTLQSNDPFSIVKLQTNADNL